MADKRAIPAPGEDAAQAPQAGGHAEMLQAIVDWHDNCWANADAADMPESARFHAGWLGFLHSLQKYKKAPLALPEPPREQ